MTVFFRGFALRKKGSKTAPEIQLQCFAVRVLISIGEILFPLIFQPAGQGMFHVPPFLSGTAVVQCVS